MVCINQPTSLGGPTLSKAFMDFLRLFLNCSDAEVERLAGGKTGAIRGQFQCVAE